MCISEGHVKDNRKPWISYDEQIDLLRRRGMVIDDVDTALEELRRVGYYRLSGYWRFFQHDPAFGDNRFREGTRFSKIASLYRSDEQLREQCGMAVAEVEVALRTSFAHVIAERHGPYGVFLKADSYTQPPKRQVPVDQAIRDDLDRARQTFVVRHRADDYRDLPVWAAVDVLSFGTLSKAIDFIRDEDVRRGVADTWGLRQMGFSSTVRSLAVLRNTCAHHSRLWNTVPPNLPDLGLKAAKIKRRWGQYDSQRMVPLLVGLATYCSAVSQSDWFEESAQELLAEGGHFSDGLRTPMPYVSAGR